MNVGNKAQCISVLFTFSLLAITNIFTENYSCCKFLKISFMLIIALKLQYLLDFPCWIMSFCALVKEDKYYYAIVLKYFDNTFQYNGFLLKSYIFTFFPLYENN